MSHAQALVTSSCAVWFGAGCWYQPKGTTPGSHMPTSSPPQDSPWSIGAHPSPSPSPTAIKVMPPGWCWLTNGLIVAHHVKKNWTESKFGFNSIYLTNPITLISSTPPFYGPKYMVDPLLNHGFWGSLIFGRRLLAPPPKINIESKVQNSLHTKVHRKRCQTLLSPHPPIHLSISRIHWKTWSPSPPPWVIIPLTSSIYHL